MQGNRKDASHKPIVLALRQAGAHVIDVSDALTAGFDALVVFRHHLFICEFKNDRRGKLTANETECREAVEYRGVRYHILTSVAEALEMLRVVSQ